MNIDVVFATPIQDILRGVWFEGSSDANIFYFSVFCLPLFVPRDGIDLTHGKRLRGNGRERWSADDPNLIEKLTEAIRNDAIPFLNSVSTLAQIRHYLKSNVDSDRPRVNTYILEALGYTLIKCGDYPSALKALAELKQRLEKSATLGGLAQKARAQLIEEKLLQSPETALTQLEAWKSETKSKLKLEKYP